ncbi:hypothetical protein Pfo_008311 [Paulownia fortunei]|nr:hypothetical protein Pfo_008311 [Paulownia fortunei]
MVVHESLDMRLMDIVTIYLYDTPFELYSIKLQRSLYGLKQSGRMWYHRLSEYLIKESYKNDPICPYIFIKRLDTEFAIIAVYVDAMNLIGTPKELANVAEYLKKEFEVKDLGKTKLCLVLSRLGDIGMVLDIFSVISVTLVATSSNHLQIIALYEAGRECVWLRSNNAACIAQVRGEYIKGDRTKYISLKFFLYMTKIYIAMYSFSLLIDFFPMGFFGLRFLTTHIYTHPIYNNFNNATSKGSVMTHV